MAWSVSIITLGEQVHVVMVKHFTCLHTEASRYTISDRYDSFDILLCQSALYDHGQRNESEAYISSPEGVNAERLSFLYHRPSKMKYS